MIDLNMLLATPPQAPQRVRDSGGPALQCRMAEWMIGSEEFRESVALRERSFP